MEAQERKHKETADQEKDSPTNFKGKTEDHAILREVISKTDDPEKRTMSAFKSQHDYSENPRFISQIRSIVDAGIDEQFAIGNPVDFSDRISKELKQDYGTVEALFFQIQDIPLKEYMLTRKVEKIKEVLVYTDCPLPEIARLLDFYNVAQLSRVLKKHTGYTFEYFVNIRREKLAVMHEAGEKRGEKVKNLEVKPD